MYFYSLLIQFVSYQKKKKIAFTEDIIWLKTLTEGWPNLLCHTSDSFTLDKLTFVLDWLREELGLQLEDNVLSETEENVLSGIELTLLQTWLKQDTKDWTLCDFDFTLERLS